MPGHSKSVFATEKLAPASCAVQISRRAVDGGSAQSCSKQRAFLIMRAVDKQLMGLAAPGCIKTRLGYPQTHMEV